MRNGQQKINIVVSTLFQDAGDATRAIEIALGIRKYAPEGIPYEITFISRGSRFEQRVLDLGFKIYHATPMTRGLGPRHDYAMTPSNFVGNKHLARELLQGELFAYAQLRPDVVIYGFWPMAGVAYRMSRQAIITGICYLPLPLTTESFLRTIVEVPEDVPLGRFVPQSLRNLIFSAIPGFIKRRCPPLRQSNLRWAARKCGWDKPLVNIFDLLKADMTIVNDMPDFYNLKLFPSDVVFTGPLFARARESDRVDPEIREIFSPGHNKLRIFCTFGSSGGLERHLLEIVRAFTFGVGENWSGVILSPECVCRIGEAKSILGDRKGVYITDKFVPAEAINAMADIVICHGGQGTLQTAISSGTPIIGVGAQAEQSINLARIEACGAGIHISKNNWNAENIQKAVLRIIDDEGFARSAKNLGKRMIAMDGQKNSAETIWRTILEKRARLGSFVPECIDHPIRQQPGDPSRIVPVSLHRHG